MRYYLRWICSGIFIFLISIQISFAQLNPERKALNRIQTGKWESANRLLRKALRKDTANVEAIYLLANWFFAKGNPDYHIDSASYYSNKSLTRYHSLSPREKEHLQKFPLDSTVLIQVRKQIDSAAFERAKQLNTETAYIDFLNSYSTADQVLNAIELRDEVSFLEALKVNKYQSYQDYLKKYPQSHRASEASQRYEKLLFNDKTRSKRLADFKKFLVEHPNSPHAAEARQEVFEISTASGQPSDFLKYMEEYPSDANRKIITDLLFHIFLDRDEKIPATILTDSLGNVLKLNRNYWIPYLKNNHFGFMDQAGNEVLTEQFDSLRNDYKCGPVFDDILELPEGYFSRTGIKIAEASVTLEDIGLGFMQKVGDECSRLIHKSGRVIINECYDEFEMVGSNFIAAKKTEGLDLFTLTGRKLPIPPITEISEVEGLIVLKLSGKKVINTIDQLAALANGASFQDDLVFDDVLVLGHQLLLVRNSGLEGIINTSLQYVVPLGRHTLSKPPFGLIEEENGKSTLRGWIPELEAKSWDKISYYRNWLVLKGNGKINLYDIPSRKEIVTEADSVWFDKSLTYVQKSASQKVFITPTHELELTPDSKINFIASRDSVQFFYTESKKKKTVFRLTDGEKLFSTEYDLLESLGIDYFLVAKGVKKGVLGKNGKPIVPVEMDIIVVSGKQLSLLKQRKFGLYDMNSKKYIKPVYEKNVVALDNNTLVVNKEGKYGLISSEGKSITEFEFSEVKPWGDSVIWAKRNYEWVLYNYFTHQTIVDHIRKYEEVKNYGEDRIAIVNSDHYFGVVSKRKGIIIPVSFTEILNLGTSDVPFYFTEKYIEEAGMYVVVYYNRDGTLVRRQAYEEEEYDRIFCEDN